MLFGPPFPLLCDCVAIVFGFLLRLVLINHFLHDCGLPKRCCFVHVSLCFVIFLLYVRATSQSYERGN